MSKDLTEKLNASLETKIDRLIVVVDGIDARLRSVETELHDVKTRLDSLETKVDKRL